MMLLFTSKYYRKPNNSFNRRTHYFITLIFVHFITQRHYQNPHSLFSLQTQKLSPIQCLFYSRDSFMACITHYWPKVANLIMWGSLMICNVLRIKHLAMRIGCSLYSFHFPDVIDQPVTSVLITLPNPKSSAIPGAALMHLYASIFCSYRIHRLSRSCASRLVFHNCYFPNIFFFHVECNRQRCLTGGIQPIYLL